MEKTLLKRILLSLLGLLLIFLPFWFGPFSLASADDIAQEDPIVDPELLAQFNRSDSTGYLIYFDAKADLSPAFDMSWEERGQFVYETLTAVASASQANIQNYLDKQGVSYTSFWIQNVIAVDNSNRATFDGVRSFSEVEALTLIPEVHLIEPVSSKSETSSPGIRAVESSLAHINADDAWGMGYTGTGLVVGSIDTGVRYTHETLIKQYRGNEGGGIFNHDYNWWDAINAGDTAYDDHNHGTHTVGTMVGDDNAGNQIGVAPGAAWIACKALDSGGYGSGTTLLKCGEFMAAPTRLDGTNPDPSMRPHVVNNSWGDCGQTYNPWFEDAIDAWFAAGIYPVFANGNAGNCGYAYPPGLGTVGNPARAYHVTGVGSTGNSNGEYANHSNWGPTDSLDTLNPMGYADLKPQVVAPGVSIRSSTAGTNSSYASYSGTSMSAPHVAGLIALMWDSAACLVGDYVTTETLLQETAVPIPYDTSGDGVPDFPNYATGWGEIDVLAAVLEARNYCGDSILAGTVYDETTLALIPGALVEADAHGDPDNDRWVDADSNGYYHIPVISGETYNLTASGYGYKAVTIENVMVTTPGSTITNDFFLPQESSLTLSGTITDGSGHGYPLYAQILVQTGDYEDEVFTNPFDGTYSVTLLENTVYDLTISSMTSGYQDIMDTGNIFNGPAATRDFALQISEYCLAPGYEIIAGLYQPFEEAVQPDNWSVVVEGDPGGVWQFNDPGGRGNLTGGTGNFAIIDSDKAGFVDVDTSLVSPTMDFSGVSSVVLAFDQDFFYYSGSNPEIADVDVSINSGAWQTVLRQTLNERGPDHQLIDISHLAQNQPDVRIRFHYYNARYDWWWQVDNVGVGTFECGLIEGGVMSGFVYDGRTGANLIDAKISSDSASANSVLTLNDPNLDNGYYWLFQPMDAGSQIVTFTASRWAYMDTILEVNLLSDAITRQDFILTNFAIHFPCFRK